MADHADFGFLEHVRQGFKPTVRPVSATESFKNLKPSEKDIPESETFDYIVVGAGPAGCIVAGKLAETNPNASVLLLEAGDVPPENPVLKIPRFWLLQQEDPSCQWGFMTTCQEGLFGRHVPILRTRCLGGGNSLFWMRGAKETFNEWVSKSSRKRLVWSLPIPSVSSEWSEALLAAAKANSMHFTNFGDESGSHHGVGYSQFTLRDGKTVNMFDVFIKRKNLSNVTVRCNSFVTHVLMAPNGSTNVAYGVHYRPSSNPCGPYCAVRARKEVILTSGVIATPLILMRSGIGNHRTLRECGIEPLLDLPGVGQNLTDDVTVALTYATEKELPVETEKFGLSNVVMSPLNSSITIGAHTNTLPGVWNMPESWKPGFQLVAMCHGLKSRGFVKMDPNNLEGPPIIEMNYLTDKKDVKQAVKAIEQLRNIGQSESLKSWRPKEVRPTEKICSKEGLEGVCARNCLWRHVSGGHVPNGWH
ncbi:hypothetical protein EMCRGX_G034359 [Ephydatia muelleri]